MMACHIAHHTSRLREQAVALVTQHVEALHPGSHALLNCGPVRVISAVAVAVDVSGTLVADVYLEPRKPVTYGKTKLPVPSIVGCFSSEDNFVQPPKTLVPAAYVPVVSAHTLKDMEQVLQETNPPHNIFDAPPPQTGVPPASGQASPCKPGVATWPVVHWREHTPVRHLRVCAVPVRLPGGRHTGRAVPCFRVGSCIAASERRIFILQERRLRCDCRVYWQTEGHEAPRSHARGVLTRAQHSMGLEEHAVAVLLGALSGAGIFLVCACGWVCISALCAKPPPTRFARVQSYGAVS